MDDQMRKQFCRSLLVEGAYSLKSVEKFIPSGVDVDEFIQGVRKSLQRADLDLVPRLCEDTGEIFHVLVNNSSGKHLSANTTFTPAEFEFFKKLLEQIVRSDNGFTTSTAALNATSSMMKKLTKADAENAISKFAIDGWIKKDKEGRISLTPRAVAELRPVLQSHFTGYLEDCFLCNDLIIKGHSCANCGTKTHRPCLRKYHLAKKSSECPSCKEVDADVAQTQTQTHTQSDMSTSQSQGGTTSRRSGKTKRAIQSDDED